MVHPPNFPLTPVEGITGSVEEILPNTTTGKPAVVDTIAAGGGGLPIPVQATNRSVVVNKTSSSEEDSGEETFPNPAVHFPLSTAVTFEIPLSHAPIEILPESGVTVGTGPYPSGGVKVAETESGIRLQFLNETAQ